MRHLRRLGSSMTLYLGVGGRDVYGLALLRLRLARAESPQQDQGQDGCLNGVE